MTESPTPWASTIQAVTIFAEDLAAMSAFYQNVFDMPVVFEDENSVVFRIGPTMINVLAIAEAPSLIEPASVANRDAGARYQFTVGVDDTDAMVAQLEAKGVTFLNGPINREWGLRTAMFADPSGHLWELAGPPTGDTAAQPA